MIKSRADVFLKLLKTELLVELINAAAGINQLLLACKERMTLGADFNTDITLGGTGFDNFAAYALDGGLLVIGMDTFLH